MRTWPRPDRRPDRSRVAPIPTLGALEFMPDLSLRKIGWIRSSLRMKEIAMTTSLRRYRIALAVCLLALPVGLLNNPTEVRAWSNGVSGPNGYGTHDWILDKAIRTLKRRTTRRTGSSSKSPSMPPTTPTQETVSSTQARPGGTSMTFTESATATLPKRSRSGSRKPPGSSPESTARKRLARLGSSPTSSGI